MCNIFDGVMMAIASPVSTGGEEAEGDATPMTAAIGKQKKHVKTARDAFYKIPRQWLDGG